MRIGIRLVTSTGRGDEPRVVIYTSAALVEEILDPAVPDDRRNQALQRLERLDS